MGNNRPLSKEEWAAYSAEVEKREKRDDTHQRTYTLLFKVLCSTCSFNAENGKRIIIDCRQCFFVKWHNCSIRQVETGVLQKKIVKLYPTVEWIKGYDHTRTERWSWKRHEAKYQQDIMGNWIPK